MSDSHPGPTPDLPDASTPVRGVPAQPSASDGAGAAAPTQPYAFPDPASFAPSPYGAQAPGAPAPGQPYIGQPALGAPSQGQPYAGQPIPGQPAPGQPGAPRQIVVSAPDLRRLAGPALTAGLTYGAMLAVAVLATIVIATSAGDVPIPDGASLRLPFILTSMALFGPLKAGGSADGYASVSASVGVIPLSLTFVGLVTAGLWTALRPHAAHTPRQRWTDALLTGGALGIGAAIVAALSSASYAVDADYVAVSAHVGVQPFVTLLGGLVVGTLGTVLGHAVRRGGAGLTGLGLRLPAGVARTLVNLAVAGAVVGALITALALVGGFANAGFGATVALLLTALPNVLVYVVTLAGFGGMVSTGELASGSTGSTVSLFSGDTPAAAFLLVLLIVLGVLIASVRGLLAAGRRPWRDGWLTPVVLAVATLLAMALTAIRVQGGGDLGMFGSGSVGGSVRISGLTVLIAAAWGLAIEAGERYAAPVVVTLVPGLARLHSRLTGGAALATAGAAPDVPGAPVNPSVPEAVSAPVIPTVNRRTAILVTVGVLGVVVLIGGTVAARAIVSKVAFSPDKPVLAYVEAVQDGRVSDAFALADPDVPTAERGLLTDEIYGAVENRPTGAKVTDVHVEGDDAWVTVESKQDGSTVSESFHVRKEGREFLVFDRWVLEAPYVPVVDVVALLPYDVDGFVVNGVEQDASGSAFRALPGTYTISLPLSEDAEGLVLSDSAQVTVLPDGNLLGGLESADFLTYQLTDEATQQAEALAAEFVQTQCLAAATLTVEECGLSIWEYREDEATGVAWAADGEPTVEAGLDAENSLVVNVSGDVTVSYALPEREFYPAEQVTDSSSYDLWISYTFDGGTLVQSEVEQYGSWGY
jgi:hypothetical protein